MDVRSAPTAKRRKCSYRVHHLSSFGGTVDARYSSSPSLRGRNSHDVVPERSSINYSTLSDSEKVHELISLQDFDGFYEATETLWEILGVESGNANRKGGAGIGDDVWATMLVVCFLEKKMRGEKDLWEMVMEKARLWLKGQIGDELVEEIEKKARNVFRV